MVEKTHLINKKIIIFTSENKLFKIDICYECA